MFIFDCNGVLVDSESIVADVASQELTRAGFAVSPEIVARFFTGRRPTDMLRDIEAATQRKLPPDFATTLAAATLRRLRAELRATAHVEHALTWLRGPKCVAVVVAAPTACGSASKAPDCCASSSLICSRRATSRAASRRPICSCMSPPKCAWRRRDCIVVEDSPAGVAAAHAAGMVPIGFIGGSHTNPNLGANLTSAGARAVIADMRALKTHRRAARFWSVLKWDDQRIGHWAGACGRLLGRRLGAASA